MITATQAPEKYLEIFDQFKNRSAAQPRWLQSLRQEAFARFAETGFPTTHDEDWRFTNVAPLAKLPFHPMFEAPAVNGAETRALNEFAFAKLTGTRLVFVNGHYSPKLSTVEKLPAGVKVGNLAAALASDAMLVEKYLGRCAPESDNAFTALNVHVFR